MNRLADRLATKWDLQYSTALHCMRARLSFTLIRATNLCLRGSRANWRSSY
uniref:Uncharacterized protein n=1 Tax=Amphimedon queenslandica TaxID=400682 RepID=A0A1X7VAI2_AMPQE